LEENETLVTTSDEEERNLEALLDLKFPVIVVLATKKMKLEDILNLCEGDVIAFKKHNSEPLDLLVNDCRIGAGKTIKVGERFGVHVREIGPARETLQKILSGS
jgi:flagellar motor switch protein FliN/FliY